MYTVIAKPGSVGPPITLLIRSCESLVYNFRLSPIDAQPLYFETMVDCVYARLPPACLAALGEGPTLPCIMYIIAMAGTDEQAAFALWKACSGVWNVCFSMETVMGKKLDSILRYPMF